MGKLNVTTIASLALNVILGLWLVSQYYYDSSFRSYVNNSLGPVSPFIILAVGLGGGSGLGYLLLKRRHSGDETGNLGKARPFRSSGPIQAPRSFSSSPQGKILPSGPPPGQFSRHTAYAVPPLAKSLPSASGGPRSTVSSSASISSKAASSPSSPPQRLDQLTQPSTSILNSTLRDQFRPEQSARASTPIPPPMPPVPSESGQQTNRIPVEPSRYTLPPQWKPEPGPSSERRPDSGTDFAKPNLVGQKPMPESSDFGSPVGQAPRPPQASQTPFPVSKWQPPEQGAGAQWTDPVPKPGLAAPQKWGPPPGQVSGPRPPPPQGGPPRPGPSLGPAGQRPQFPPGQGPPRPLVYPSPNRPGQPGPIGVPPPFRSDQPRPPGPPGQGRPVQPMGGPVPQPWTPPRPADKGEPAGAPQDRGGIGSPEPRSPQGGASEAPRPPENQSVAQSPSGGEMDWDTALDTILKTLKKDRGVGERQ